MQPSIIAIMNTSGEYCEFEEWRKVIEEVFDKFSLLCYIRQKNFLGIVENKQTSSADLPINCGNDSCDIYEDTQVDRKYPKFCELIYTWVEKFDKIVIVCYTV